MSLAHVTGRLSPEVTDILRVKTGLLEETLKEASAESIPVQKVPESMSLDPTWALLSATPPPSSPISPEGPVDIEKSKYFRMNSYAISSMDHYTLGAEADFRPCFDLPAGWKFRYCGPPTNPEKSTHFVTPDRRVIKSRLGAIEILRLSGRFTRKELWEYATYLHVPEKRFEKLF